MAEKMQNINIGISNKKAFTIDGDENKVIELDTSDFGVVSRLNESLEKIQNIQSVWDELGGMAKAMPEASEVDFEDVTKFSEKFAKCERSMRDVIDFIFDSSVCDVILGGKSIFSPRNGKLAFEVIIDSLSTMYEDNIKNETQKLNKRKMSKYTAKYIK